MADPTMKEPNVEDPSHLKHINPENASNTARSYICRFGEARVKFNRNETEESYALCKELLLNADLPLVVRARAHGLLTYNDENYVWHARQAVHYREQVSRLRPDNDRYKKSLQLSREMLEIAEDEHESEVEMKLKGKYKTTQEKAEKEEEVQEEDKEDEEAEEKDEGDDEVQEKYRRDRPASAGS